MPCNFCCTGRNIQALRCRYLVYRKMSTLYLTFLAPFLFRLIPKRVIFNSSFNIMNVLIMLYALTTINGDIKRKRRHTLCMLEA